MARQVRKEELENNPIFSEIIRNSRQNSPTNENTATTTLNPPTIVVHNDVRRTSKTSSINDGSVKSNNNENLAERSRIVSAKRISNFTENDLKTNENFKNGANGRANSIHLMENCSNESGSVKNDSCERNSKDLRSRRPSYHPKSIINLLQSLHNRWRRILQKRNEYSFYIFHPNHK